MNANNIEESIFEHVSYACLMRMLIFAMMPNVLGGELSTEYRNYFSDSDAEELSTIVHVSNHPISVQGKLIRLILRPCVTEMGNSVYVISLVKDGHSQPQKGYISKLAKSKNRHQFSVSYYGEFSYHEGISSAFDTVASFLKERKIPFDLETPDQVAGFYSTEWIVECRADLDLAMFVRFDLVPPFRVDEFKETLTLDVAEYAFRSAISTAANLAFRGLLPIEYEDREKLPLAIVRRYEAGEKLLLSRGHWKNVTSAQ